MLGTSNLDIDLGGAELFYSEVMGLICAKKVAVITIFLKII